MGKWPNRVIPKRDLSLKGETAQRGVTGAHMKMMRLGGLNPRPPSYILGSLTTEPSGPGYSGFAHINNMIANPTVFLYRYQFSQVHQMEVRSHKRVQNCDCKMSITMNELI
jgi:hypothetical protein